MKTVRFIVDGEVQGKTYRPHIVAKARKHKVGGYVKNLPDGTVEIVCSGNETVINAFYEDITREAGKELKDCLADVTQVSSPEELSPKEYEYFAIEYGEMNEEMAEGLSTGAAYIRELRGDMNNNFNTLDEKYHTVSESLDSLSSKIDSLPDKLADKLSDSLDSLPDKLAKKFSETFSFESLAKVLEEHDKRLIDALREK